MDVSLFFVVNGKFLIHSCKKENGEKYGDFINYPQSHNEVWDKYYYKKYHVDFDYFPRGRVMVDPEYDLDGNFEEYSCIVFLDKCINNDVCKEMIVNYYNLGLPSIHRVKWSMLGERAGIDHYQCHSCKL